MKTQLVAFILLFVLGSSCKSSKTSISNEMIEISGKILTTKSYCGGAPPSQQTVDRINTPKPHKNAVFYIKKGQINNSETPVFEEVKTDLNGNFNIKIPKGNYILLNSSQANRDIIDEKMENIRIVDEVKLNEWWENGIVTISAQDTKLDTVFHKNCDIPLAVPYLKYTGPPRPGRM